MYDEDYEHESINFFRDIDEYMAQRSKLEVGTDRLFLAVNPKAKHRREFFKRQHLGKNSFTGVVEAVCRAEGIEGSGKKNGVTAHGLRGTMASLLFEKAILIRLLRCAPAIATLSRLRAIIAKVPRRDLGFFQGPIVDGLVQNTNPAAHIGTITGGTVNVTVNVYHSEQQRSTTLEQEEK